MVSEAGILYSARGVDFTARDVISIDAMIVLINASHHLFKVANLVLQCGSDNKPRGIRGDLSVPIEKVLTRMENLSKLPRETDRVDFQDAQHFVRKGLWHSSRGGENLCRS
jgi:hypothetical protein